MVGYVTCAARPLVMKKHVTKAMVIVTDVGQVFMGKNVINYVMPASAKPAIKLLANADVFLVCMGHTVRSCALQLVLPRTVNGITELVRMVAEMVSTEIGVNNSVLPPVITICATKQRVYVTMAVRMVSMV